MVTLRSDLAYAQLSQNNANQSYQLNNPISVPYLKKNLQKAQPRLVLNQATEKRLREKLQTDPLIQHIYQAIKYNAASVLALDLITVDIPDNPRSQQNQLGISRDFLYRINMLGMVYFVEKNPDILQRLNEEVFAACNFPTWNPKHFLDVGEMSLAIALALDWTAGKLPKSTISLAKKSLIEKGIMPSWPENGETPRWVNGTNNWNQVCNAGMIAASIAIAEENPELAAKTMKRSIEGMNHALAAYAPDGAYPEGATYWGYGTMFSAVTAAMLESAFGTDFGIGDYPGFKESANFGLLTTAPSKLLYNYADSPDVPELYTDFTLSWFASKTGDRNYLNTKRFMQTPDEIGKISRLAGAGLVWTAQFEEKESGLVQSAWKGEGANPIVIFTGQGENKEGYYFGGKGGRGSISHGNMDAGSFIFELNGVRWVIDPGNQSYGVLSRAGFDLWNRCQECDRWKLLTKNNFGHSTISVDNKRHIVDGLATLVDFKGGKNPEATFDLTPTFAGQLKSAARKFIKDSPRSIIIEDQIETNDATKLITWQLMTQADIELVDGGAVLTQDGKTLKLENLSHPEFNLSIVSLYPAPLQLDKQIENLKRIELRIPSWVLEENKGEIKVRLSGE
ncbi:heparinase II/III domain-containing protein [Cyclobacterium marinum]|uniref:heparinase II/III domain-containing protein n=1 Tax=Cyclobacterium marinum TaxID=104 RepID=UPI0011ECC449|nr:heparinase II/III family protein [Cyclobacterium marinum]MBI0397375.1 heparinase II/III family protein [Cyclobacterium marinum]